MLCVGLSGVFYRYLYTADMWNCVNVAVKSSFVGFKELAILALERGSRDMCFLGFSHG